MVPPHFHHQVSMESVIDPSAPSRLSSYDKAQAQSIFKEIIQHCENYEQENRVISTKNYKRGALLQLVYDYSISDLGQESILKYFLFAITATPEENSSNYQNFSHVLSNLSNFNAKNKSQKDEIAKKAQELADHLVNSFFLPLKASSAKTPQPSPHLTPPPREGGDIFVGTTQRLSSLRGQCLVRDQHRCVISRHFDLAKGVQRFDNYGEAALDDAGNLLSGDVLEALEVAHIIPHSLTSFDDGQNILNQAKTYTLRILNMFDPGVIHLIEGAGIDRPYNAISLTTSFHQLFGSLRIYFEATSGVDHTYTIKSTQPNLMFRSPLPTNQAFFITPNHTIEPPSPRLLAIHRACCLILHISGAGAYIDKVLRDREEGEVKSDGSTELGTLVSLELGRWKTTKLSVD